MRRWGRPWTPRPGHFSARRAPVVVLRGGDQQGDRRPQGVAPAPHGVQRLLPVVTQIVRTRSTTVRRRVVGATATAAFSSARVYEAHRRRPAMPPPAAVQGRGRPPRLTAPLVRALLVTAAVVRGATGDLGHHGPLTVPGGWTRGPPVGSGTLLAGGRAAHRPDPEGFIRSWRVRPERRRSERRLNSHGAAGMCRSIWVTESPNGRTRTQKTHAGCAWPSNAGMRCGARGIPFGRSQSPQFRRFDAPDEHPVPGADRG